jgi:exodeoxyribonuclease-5
MFSTGITDVTDLKQNNLALDWQNFSIKLTEEQEKAIKTFRDWFINNKRGYFSLLGCAGTGKSSLIPYLIDSLNLKSYQVAVCSYTGKAALVLKRKGIKEAKTIHQTIYDVKVVKVPPPENVKIIFSKKRSLSPAKLIIVDEASMIDEEMHNDLMSFNVPILYIGDPFQLPPIVGNWNVMQHCDFQLTEILRQAKESPIIQLAEMVKNKKSIPYQNGELVSKIYLEDFDNSMFADYEQIGVGTNAQREAINKIYREEFLGITAQYPTKDEKLVVLKNNYYHNLYNGQCLILGGYDSIRNIMGKQYHNLHYIDEVEYNDVVLSLQSEGFKLAPFALDVPQKDYSKHRSNEVIFADYGYALTVHKMQGSQWDSVLIFDGGFGVWDRELRSRWLYTAITRAKEKLMIVGGKRK